MKEINDVDIIEHVPQSATPAAVQSGRVLMYFKIDGNLYKNTGGVETQLTADTLVNNLDGGTPNSMFGGTTAIDGGTP